MFTVAFVLRVGFEAIEPQLPIGMVVPGVAVIIGLFTANAYTIERSYRDVSYAVEHCVAFAIAYLAALAISEFVQIESFRGIMSRAADFIGFALTAVTTLIVRRVLYMIVMQDAHARTIGVLGNPVLIRQLANDLAEVGDPRRIVAIVLEAPGELLLANCVARYPEDPASEVRKLPESCDSIVVTGDSTNLIENS